MKIAILALQGAFEEHQQMLHSIGVDTFLVRNLNDWQEEKDGLILPGGESTAMMRIMNDEGLFEPLRSAIISGLPVFGTCAGLILLDNLHLNTMNIEAKRNAYGRQLGSFHCLSEFDGLGVVPMTFIRAPYISSIKDNVDVLATVDDRIVAVQYNNQIGLAFHPELSGDTRIHEYFISLSEK